MDIIYPYSSPIIMTDDFYATYGGDVTIGTAAQRQIAYWIAERAVSEDLHTFLQPTVVTGTYTYTPVQPFLLLKHHYINSVDVIRFLDTKEYAYYSVTGTANVRVSLRNSEYGTVDLHYIIGNCNCHSRSRPYPYQVQAIYTAGLSTGTSTLPDFGLALSSYADIMVNEMVGYGNEAPGDIGIQEYKNQQYSEKRVGLLRTTYGSSAKAQFINGLVNKYRKRGYAKLGW